MGNRKIMVLRPQDLPLRHLDAKINLKIPILYFWNIQVALSQIDNEKFKYHGAATSGLTLETSGCKIVLKIPI